MLGLLDPSPLPAGVVATARAQQAGRFQPPLQCGLPFSRTHLQFYPILGRSLDCTVAVSPTQLYPNGQHSKREPDVSNAHRLLMT